MVIRMLTEGHGIEAAVGAAGAGKSTLMDACRIAWDASGITYAGACLSAVAAKNLTESSGIPSKTVAAWLHEIENGKGLRGVDVLCIDEATMVDDRAAARLMTEAARTGTKIIAIGDHLQLQAIGPGGWFRETHYLVNGLTLTENRRQEDAAERAALDIWRTGDHELALRMLAEGGRVHAAETADEARSQILTTWDEIRSHWPNPQDLAANLAVLAARNSHVDALNLGAQQIRRAAGELGDEHTYALPGGDTLTLAVGDLVRVRANDYRSRRGEGPDVLNGYRAVITAMDAEHRVKITWRVKDVTAEAGYRYESAWVKPERIASGALSLGYAMTIAASQGLTCHTSLMYGHGANAFATYPGITRARRANHIWLPLAVIEDEETQARLGTARSEKELLPRAVLAFARFLGQSKPDHMISDLLRERPAPAQLPAQPAATEARATERVPHRAPPWSSLTPAVEQAEREAHRRRQASHARPDSKWEAIMADAITKLRSQDQGVLTRALATAYGIELPPHTVDEAQEAITRTRQRVSEFDARLEAVERKRYKLSSEQREQLGQMRLKLERVAILPITARPYGSLSVEGLARQLADAEHGASRAELAVAEAIETERLLSERLAAEGTTGQTRGEAYAVELHRLVDQVGELLADDDRSESGDGSQATREAWEAIRTSDLAGALGIPQDPAEAPQDLGPQLAELCDRASRLGHDLDKRARTELASAHQRAAREREAVQRFRSVATELQAEVALRDTIATRHPELHDIEESARLNQSRGQGEAPTPQQVPDDGQSTAAEQSPPQPQRNQTR
ncbi:AAA family ATPase [Streptomyces sp. SCSIO 30461]|uniref:AAA family ATPase n=1 Tax=Streptomyces sp. SCSIO 30461 TaxID=3118085 RepID=UPI0030D4B291